MQKYLSLSSINPLKRALASLNILTMQRYNHSKDMQKVRNQQSILDQHHSNQYSDILSYAYRLFDCKKENSIYQFQVYNDRDIGGSSKGEVKFNREEKCLEIQGFIDAKDKEKLEQHPSFGIARTHPYRINCGPFNSLQVQLQSDGEPIHIGVQLQSPIQGLLACYGIITSKVKAWKTYQLPFHNMLVVGAEHGPRGTHNYQMVGSQHTFFDREAYDARRVLLTETKHPIIRDVNIRLLGTKSTHRKVGLRAINLVRRAQSKRFIEEYRHPYFFIVDSDPYVFNKEIGVSWLSKSYSDLKLMDHISTGDRVYKKSPSQTHSSGKQKH